MPELERFAYYWVRLKGPDGDGWNVAQFVETKHEYWDYWNNRPSFTPQSQNYWYVAGMKELQRQVQTKAASNQWEIGQRILTPSTPEEQKRRIEEISAKVSRT